MIVPNMTSDELANEIMADIKNVRTKIGYASNKIRRIAIKSPKKHHQHMLEYTSPMKNNWIVFINYYLKEPVYVPVVHYLNQYGLNGIMVSEGDISLQHYTSHFLDRYNQRFLKKDDMSKLELLKHFIKQNPMAQTQSLPDDKDYANQIFGRFSEGMGFGYKERLTRNILFHFKTFVSSEMRFENQEEIFQSTSESYKAFWDDVYGYRNVDAFGDEE
ncbi:MAG: hypothetical protein N4A71_14845 [Carboxylicivirga sp.]|nr:hypothetical protein [Carboxylicivirga sp.]